MGSAQKISRLSLGSSFEDLVVQVVQVKRCGDESDVEGVVCDSSGYINACFHECTVELGQFYRISWSIFSRDGFLLLKIDQAALISASAEYCLKYILPNLPCYNLSSTKHFYGVIVVDHNQQVLVSEPSNQQNDGGNNGIPFPMTHAQTSENVSDVVDRLLQHNSNLIEQPLYLLQVPPITFLTKSSNSEESESQQVNQYEFYLASCSDVGKGSQFPGAQWVTISEPKRWPEEIARSKICEKVFSKLRDSLEEVSSLGLFGEGCQEPMKDITADVAARDVSIVLVGGLQQESVHGVMKQIGCQQAKLGQHVAHIKHSLNNTDQVQEVLNNKGDEAYEVCADCTDIGSVCKAIHEIVECERQFDYIIVENHGVIQVEDLKILLGVDSEDDCYDDSCCDDEEYGYDHRANFRIHASVSVVDASSALQDMCSDQPAFSTKDSQNTENDQTSLSTASLLLHSIESATHILIYNSSFIPNSMRSYIEVVLRHLNHTTLVFTYPFGICDDSSLELNQLVSQMGKIDKMESIGWENLVYDVNVPEIKETCVDGVAVSSFVYRARKPFHPERLFQFMNRYYDVESPAAEEAEEGEGEGEEEDTDFEDMKPKFWKSKQYKSDLGRVIRSAGEVWLCTRRDAKALWMQSGKVVQLSNLGFWFDAIPRQFWPQKQEGRQKILNEFIEGIGDRQQRIAFIGINLNYNKIKQELNDCLCTEEEMENRVSVQDRFSVWPSNVDIFGDTNVEIDIQEISEEKIEANQSDLIDKKVGNLDQTQKQKIQKVENVISVQDNFGASKQVQQSQIPNENSIKVQKFQTFEKNNIVEQSLPCKKSDTENKDLLTENFEQEAKKLKKSNENTSEIKTGKFSKDFSDPKLNLNSKSDDPQNGDNRWSEKVEFGKVQEILDGGSQLQDVLDQISEIGTVETVFVDWHAPWSIQCVEFKQIFEQIAKNAENNKKFMFVGVDVQASFYNKKLAMEKIMEYPVSRKPESMPQIKWGGKFPAVTLHTPPNLYFNKLLTDKQLPEKVFEVTGDEFRKNIVVPKIQNDPKYQIDLEKQELEYAQGFEKKLNVIKRGVRQFKDVVKAVGGQKTFIIVWTTGEEEISFQIREFLQHFAPKCSNKFIFLDIDVKMSQHNLWLSERVEIEEFPSFSTTKGTKLTPGKKISSFEGFKSALLKLTNFNSNKIPEQNDSFSFQNEKNNDQINLNGSTSIQTENNLAASSTSSQNVQNAQNSQNVQIENAVNADNLQNVQNRDTKNVQNVQNVHNVQNVGTTLNGNSSSSTMAASSSSSNKNSKKEKKKQSVYDPPGGRNNKGGATRIFEGQGQCVFYPKMPCLECGCPWWLGEDWDAKCVRCGWDCEGQGYDDDSKPLPKYQTKWKQFVEQIKQGVTPEWPQSK